jgi:hypothetical protein
MADLDDLRALAQRYSRAVDARDIDAVADLFDPEGTGDGARGSSTVPEYLGQLRDAPRVFEQSMHVLGDPLITFESGSDHAALDTYAIVYQLGRVGGDGSGGARSDGSDGSDGSDMVLGIRYLDDVIRTGTTWRIHHRQAIILWSRDLTR